MARMTSQQLSSCKTSVMTVMREADHIVCHSCPAPKHMRLCSEAMKPYLTPPATEELPRCFFAQLAQLRRQATLNVQSEASR